jgi:hypothetical protein
MVFVVIKYMLNSLNSVGSIWLYNKVATPPPATPTGFAITTIGATYVTFSFTAVVNATSYTVTATPTTNTHEVYVIKQFTSTSYTLGVLSPSTNYTFYLVANNSSGSSNSTTATAITYGLNIFPIPSSSYTYNFTYSSTILVAPATNGYYSYISIPKTVPNNMYLYAFNDVVSTVNYPQLLYSSDSGASFIDISGRLKFSNGVNQSSSYGAGLACSDNGTFVYVQPSYHRVNYSRDSGATFNYNTGDLGAILPDNNPVAYSLRTNTTGEIIFVAGTVSTGAVYKIAWSNDSGNTYKNLSCSDSTCIEVNSSTNRIYIGGTDVNGAATRNNLYYYTATSKANLLSLDISAVTFTMVTINATTATRVIKISSVGNLTVLLTSDTTKKVYLSTNGITFSSVTYFQTSNTGNALTCEPRSLIFIEPYVGFILIGDTTRIFYSFDSGSSWVQYSGITLTGTGAFTSVAGFVENANFNAYITETGDSLTKLHKIQSTILFSSSMSFTGTTALVLRPPVTNSKTIYSVGTTAFTLEAWIYPTNDTKNGQGILAITPSGSTATHGTFGIYLDGTKLRLDSHNIASQSMATTIAKNTWTHIAYVRENTSSGYVYVNGVASYLDGSTTVTQVTDLSIVGRNIVEVYLTIGTRFSNTTFDLSTLSFNGYISQVRFCKSNIYSGNFTPPPRFKLDQMSVTNASGTTVINAVTSANVLALVHSTSDNVYIDAKNTSNLTFVAPSGATTTMSVPTRNNLCNY